MSSGHKNTRGTGGGCSRVHGDAPRLPAEPLRVLRCNACGEEASGTVSSMLLRGRWAASASEPPPGTEKCGPRRWSLWLVFGLLWWPRSLRRCSRFKAHVGVPDLPWPSLAFLAVSEQHLCSGRGSDVVPVMGTSPGSRGREG